MDNDPTDKISSQINKLTERFKFPKLNLIRSGGLKILTAAVVLVIVCYNLFFVYVRPDEYGIKVVRVGLNRGVQKKIYHAGLSFVLPFGLQQMYRLPKGIQEMNNALAGFGGEAIVKLRIAEALQGKHIMLLPVSEGGMNLKTTDINRLIETLGVKSISGGQ